jgi:hypothetical protein
VLAAVRGKDAEGKAVRRLGDTAESKYIRTLMPRGAPEEDGLIYLSDPFIRRLIGPQVKLTERRRLLCYNHLRTIGHAAQMYRTEFGRSAKSLDELAAAGCCPGPFNKGELVCPDGGRYTLAADGSCGVCSHHGRADQLRPCAEVLVRQVTGEEADLYKGFLDEYNQYWRTYFYPIAVRLQVGPKRLRVETVILPLIDYSIYTAMAKTFGGAPEHLDSLPLSPRTIFSVNVRLNKEELLRQLDPPADGKEAQNRLWDLGLGNKEVEDLGLKELFARGLGNQAGLHVCDSAPMFDLNMPALVGLLMGSFTGPGGARQKDAVGVQKDAVGVGVLLLGFVAASLTTPTYMSFPVEDAKVVDRFLARLDRVAAAGVHRGSGGFLGIQSDFYKFPLKGERQARSMSVRFGPVKFRTFWARIGKGLHSTNQPSVLEDLLAAEVARAKGKGAREADRGPKAHAMVRLRPQNWEQVLTGYRLGWAENNHQACLHNLGPLSSGARAYTAVTGGQKGANPCPGTSGRARPGPTRTGCTACTSSARTGATTCWRATARR